MATINVQIPNFRKYDLINDHDANVIFPVVWLRGINGEEDKIIWEKPEDPHFHIKPGQRREFDLLAVTGGRVRNHALVYLGAGVIDIDPPERPYDSKVELTYIVTSRNTIIGHYTKDGTVKIEPPKVEPADALVDPAPVEAQTSIAALPNTINIGNAPNVAKLLISLANLISPDL